MILDFDAQMLQPIYDVLGVDARLTTEAGVGYDLTIIDKSAGVEVAMGNMNATRGSMSVSTMRPAAVVRRAALVEKSIALADVDDAQITFNGHRWRIISGLPKANPQGEESGEVYFLLADEKLDA